MIKNNNSRRNLMDLLKDNETFSAESNNHNKLEDSEFVFIPIDQLKPSRYQPRRFFDPEAFKELTQSIKEKGILTPLLVWSEQKKDAFSEKIQYEILSGERRYRAALSLGINTIPCRILMVDHQEAAAVALLDNIQRQNISVLEEAQGYQQILNENSQLTQEDLSVMIGKSRSHIANMLRLLKSDPIIQDSLNQGKISFGHAKILMNSQNPLEFCQLIIEKNLSVRQAETYSQEQSKKINPQNNKYTKKIETKNNTPDKTTFNPQNNKDQYTLNSDNDEDLASIKETLSRIIYNDKIQLSSNGKKFFLSIEFDNQKKWENFYEKIVQL